MLQNILTNTHFKSALKCSRGEKLRHTDISAMFHSQRVHVYNVQNIFVLAHFH